ncbi:MAG: efflux RND transporter periplasmic adaptor subunit [Spongiibacteraceae bacterium]|jgi:membrane fusion protein (multidrug efflux system)|nr:efflux RND transporter periplasmic adaptor subunit [Spongiibacteraceae bacterium]
MRKSYQQNRMWFIVLVTTLLFAAVLFMQWFGRQKMNEFFDNMPIPPASVTAAAAITETLQPSLTAVGTLMPVNGANLATEVPGIVDAIHFDNGATVEAGAVVVTLDTAADRAELESLKAAARLAEIELQRVRQLAATRSTSQADVDRRQSELDQARANVAAQEARIEQKTLRAPFAGVLGIRQVNLGQFVAAGDTIIGLQSLDPLFLNFTLPETYIAAVTTGDTVIARVDALDERTFSGIVTAIEPSVDARTRNFTVQATLRNPGQLLRPGMFASAELKLGEPRPLVVIPQSAVGYRPYGTTVFVLTPAESAEQPGLHQVEQRFVTLGNAYGDLIEVREGLADGELVATSGLLKLRHGGHALIDNRVQPDASLHPAPANG